MSLKEDAQDQQDRAAAEKTGKDPRFLQLERLAAELYGEGKDFRIERGQVMQAAKDRDSGRETALDFGKEHIRLGVLSDTHGGSKFEQLTALRAFYRYADEREVDAFIHAGDAHQGPDAMHRGMVHEVHAHEADVQGDYVAATFPRSERGKSTYMISGNHDDAFLNNGGVNMIRRLAKNRDDIVYVGQDAAYLTIGGLRAYVAHPDGGATYAKSYKAQKFAEALPVDKDVRLLLLGHYHVYGSFRERRTHAFMVPCFQSQYAWLARKGLHPDIGALILDLWLDDDGGLARVTHELVTFPILEEDWDHDVSDSVSRAWSSQGLEVDPPLTKEQIDVGDYA